MGKVFIETFGCQMNVLDSELILSRLQAQGWSPADRREEADLILFNTCSVREHAEERALSHAGLVQRLKARKPDLVVGIVGCMAQNRQDRLFEQLPHVQLVVGPRHFGAIPRLVEEVRATGRRRIAVADFDDEFIDGAEALQSRANRFQAYVKAMEGCDLSCTYCVVPMTRGREVSRPPDRIVEEVRRLADQGTVEVTLLGQTVNSYGKGLRPPCDLAELLRRVSEVEGIRRLRFITSHPSFVRPSLVAALRDLPKVCKYLHIPPQSGSNRILKAMRRGYTVERYVEICDTLRSEVPGIEIAGDFIVGFPGETPAEFEETVALLERIRFQNAFLFKYSPRPGTDAAALPDDVPEPEKARRHQVLLEVQERISLQKNRARVGQRLEVLVEGPSKRDPRRQTGRTDTHQVVNFDAGRDLRGRFVTVEITGATAHALSGTLA
ncbi:MAG TPA: tRNA (N6-isopentenyl adenosine(37)-C2)-methylthiotransferase MiaB [Planctomycetota bacterium]|jgi:tRNA-2-methylthio-N6-dimethylallyladenosine synthase|nr:tRNA (N6-isopentenyl adenosine(37)-C2)-methylthiotransferase MiaB [Planctomycetota bacterium]